MAENLSVAIRGSTGLRLGQPGAVKPFPPDDLRPLKDRPCRVFEYSNGGRFFLYCDTTKTELIDLDTNKVVVTLDLKRTMSIAFSPKDTYFMLWEPYVTYAGEGQSQTPDPNLRIFNTNDGSPVTALISHKQATWKPVFSEDEKVMIRQAGSEILVHQGIGEELFSKFVFKKSFPKFDNYALSPNGQYIAIFTPPQGAAAGNVHVCRVDPKFSVVNTKNFFNGDKTVLFWNSKSTAVLILAHVEVDSTNKSYYGQSYLYLINVMTGDSCPINLGKNGPVYAVRWSPKGTEFAVCYGYMPAKVTFYNFRGDPVFDLQEGPRNDIHYNVFGNILLVCGFGNLSLGKMEFWDTEKRKLIISIEVPNTTYFEWAPDGRHFLTATTTPRLRIDNNYRLWHYSGKLLQECLYDSPNEELWQAQFRPWPKSSLYEFNVQPLTSDQKMQAGLLLKKTNGDQQATLIAAGAVKKAGAYVPPHLRNGNGAKAAAPPAAGGTKVQQVLSEAEKKIRALQKKVDDIAKLKEKRDRGETLQINQIEKIEKEDELVASLEALKLSAGA
ncbi:unnamed protein product, partial [Mesorhabditis spiculigera]